MRFNPQSRFQIALADIIEKAGLTIDELAKKADLSKNYRKNLNDPSWEPTTRLLREIAPVILGRVQPREIIKLIGISVLSEAEYESTRWWYENLPETDREHWSNLNVILQNAPVGRAYF